MVSVVGTLLALLVFFALFGVFLTQYVPLWMSENEQALTGQVQTSLANLKAGIDGQIASQGPAVVANPLPMASQGIPLIAQPTQASVVFLPPTPQSSSYSNVSMKPGPGGLPGWFYENQTIGTLEVKVPNRYYPAQTFSYENDAVVQAQGSGQQIVEFPPTLSVNQTGGGFGVTASLVQIVGASTVATGLGTQEVFTHFVYSYTFTSTSTSSSPGITANFVDATLYPCAWASFVNSTFSKLPSGFASHYTMTAPKSCGTPGATYPFAVHFTGLTSFTLIWAEVRLVIGVGTE